MQLHICINMYVCTCVCMYVHMFVRPYLFLYTSFRAIFDCIPFRVRSIMHMNMQKYLRRLQTNTHICIFNKGVSNIHVIIIMYVLTTYKSSRKNISSFWEFIYTYAYMYVCIQRRHHRINSELLLSGFGVRFQGFVNHRSVFGYVNLKDKTLWLSFFG